MTQKNEMGFLKKASMQIVSGGSAGLIEATIMHPLDIIKTRFQVQSKANIKPGDPIYYTGIVDCFRKIVKQEGFFALWKGVVPPLFVETPKRAVKFFTFEQYKGLFYFGSPTPTALTFSFAGCCAGATEALLVNPFEVVKITLQTNRGRFGRTPTTWFVTKRIIAEDGFGNSGLYKAIWATIIRNAIFNSIYFGFYHSVKNNFPQHSDPTIELLRKIGIGFISGTLGSVFNIPFDVVKSRMQGPQPIPGQVKYKTVQSTIRLIYKEEGISAFYKGIVPKIMRLGPGGAIMLLAFENIYEFLQEKFPD